MIPGRACTSGRPLRRRSALSCRAQRPWRRHGRRRRLQVGDTAIEGRGASTGSLVHVRACGPASLTVRGICSSICFPQKMPPRQPALPAANPTLPLHQAGSTSAALTPPRRPRARATCCSKQRTSSSCSNAPQRCPKRTSCPPAAACWPRTGCRRAPCGASGRIGAMACTCVPGSRGAAAGQWARWRRPRPRREVGRRARRMGRVVGRHCLLKRLAGRRLRGRRLYQPLNLSSQCACPCPGPSALPEAAVHAAGGACAGPSRHGRGAWPGHPQPRRFLSAARH